MQQQLMQHRPNVTTHHIQQYLDENKALILNILEYQTTGKFSECAENQTRLQHNLMYLAAIADCQPKSSIHLQQQQQQQQLQQMVSNSHMLGQFGQQPPFTIMQQQQQDLHSQLGMCGTSMEGQGSGVFHDFNYGEASYGTSKENRSTSSSEGVHQFPQKKGKLTRTAT